jgi:hypothetical protein
LRNHREPHRPPRRIVQHTIRVPVFETGRSQQRPGACRVVWVLRDRRGEPCAIARGYRTEDRHRGTEVDRIGDRLPVDGERDRLTHAAVVQPRHAGARRVGQIEPEEVRVQPDARIHEA